MNEAERRAAFEAAVVEALQGMLIYLYAVDDTTKSTASMLAMIHRGIENVRTIHETEPDAPAATEAGA